MNYKSKNSIKKNLPYDGLALVLGIISLFGCFCLGFIGLIAGISSLMIYKSQKKKYLQNPADYLDSSLKRLGLARFLAIAGTSLSSLFLLIILLFIVSENKNYILEFPWNLLK
jgi:hypothetical protein